MKPARSGELQGQVCIAPSTHAPAASSLWSALIAHCSVTRRGLGPGGLMTAKRARSSRRMDWGQVAVPGRSAVRCSNSGGRGIHRCGRTQRLPQQGGCSLNQTTQLGSGFVISRSPRSCAAMCEASWLRATPCIPITRRERWAWDCLQAVALVGCHPCSDRLRTCSSCASSELMLVFRLSVCFTLGLACLLGVWQLW